MATETLRPNGDSTPLELVAEGAGDHYVEVDEVSHDDDTTRVKTESTAAYEADLYTLPNHSEGSGTINSVTCYVICRHSSAIYTGAGGKPLIKTHDTIYGDAQALPYLSFEALSQQWATNPNTTIAWTWDEIDALLAGISLQAGVSISPADLARCTQVYVEVDYTPVAVPTGGAGAAAELVAMGVI